ncbi:MAG: phosphotransferase [Actinomycetota bacterium]
MSGDRGEEAAHPLVEPVVRLVETLGVEAAEPRVIRVGANLVVHLAPAPIVARVATLTAEMRGRPLDYLRRERVVCDALMARGVNIVATTDLVDPGPHEVDGTACLLLNHHRLAPVDFDSSADAVRVGRAFAQLSAALCDLPSHLGGGDGAEADDGQPWEEVAVLMRTVAPTTEASTVDRIAGVVETLRAGEPDDRWQLVHGDAHRSNVALDDRGEIIWFDFEDTNRRPPAWDLASLHRSWPAAGRVAADALGVELGSYSVRWHHELREVYALLWNLLYAQRFPESRAATADRAATWLTRPVEQLLRRY